ncbi:C1 family peptidase [Neolewinella agarilytica]|uniref:Papain family cysteine protease n=1 Tax=Neolewinella agarilytica TaxID=478744 RepID=A0A1H9CBP2_9BACT|nr:C1 family peptidase [Neolewinella agarilytica]SEP98559.1 Papain family cysteine protease [Neolewinella agarilytica]
MRATLFLFLLLASGFLAAQNFVQIESRWQKNFGANPQVHLQEPSPAFGLTEAGWWSKDWIVEDAGGGYVRFKNRWRGTYLLQNVDVGPTEAGAIKPGWWSAQWTIEPAGGNFVRIKNRWRGTYLHIHNAGLECGPMEPGQWGAQWVLKGYKGAVAPQPGPNPDPKPQPQPKLGPAHDISNLSYGATPTPPAIKAYVKKVAVGGSNTAPKTGVFNLDMPPIGNQGSEGSCVAWALGYGIMSYEMRKRSGLDYYYLGTKNLNTMQIGSPEYLFNRVNLNNKDCSNGSYFVGTPERRGALDHLKYAGIAPLAAAPYSDRNGCGTVDNYKEPENPLAAMNKIDQYALIENDQLTERNLKSLLNDGYPILVGANLTTAFKQGRRGYVWDTGVGGVNGTHAAHAMVIMGYDDSKRAFKLQNSWGTNWGDDGYGWIGYDHVKNAVFEAYVVYADRLDGFEITEPNYVTVYSEALYVANVTLTYTLNGQAKKFEKKISAFFSFEHQLPKQARNVRLKVDGILVTDPLNFDKTFNSNSIQACYKIWGSFLDTEYATMECSY